MWLEDKNGSAPAAYIVDADGTSASTDSSGITYLLASALYLATGN